MTIYGSTCNQMPELKDQSHCEAWLAQFTLQNHPMLPQDLDSVTWKLTCLCTHQSTSFRDLGHLFDRLSSLLEYCLVVLESDLDFDQSTWALHQVSVAKHILDKDF